MKDFLQIDESGRVVVGVEAQFRDEARGADGPGLLFVAEVGSGIAYVCFTY